MRNTRVVQIAITYLEWIVRGIEARYSKEKPSGRSDGLKEAAPAEFKPLAFLFFPLARH